MPLTTLQTLIASDMDAVNNLIKQRVYSRVSLVNTIGEHIINSGGKRIRPMLVLLIAKALGYRGVQHRELAVIIEFIHTATLLHDDVVDGSLLRRGLDTANAIWGPQASVLVGDFLYSRAFQMMVALNDMRVMNVLATTTNVIAEGEVLQLLNINDADTSQARYLDVLRCKTAELFAAATQLGALVSSTDATLIDAMRRFGHHLGMAYQLIDDLLDYQSDAATLGKNRGDDLAEGKPTLPLIYLMKHGSASQIALVRDAIENADSNKFSLIQDAIIDSGALAYTRQIAASEQQSALDALALLPASAYKMALIDLLDFVVNRDH